MKSFWVSDLDGLWPLMESAKRIIGFNTIKFDVPCTFAPRTRNFRQNAAFRHHAIRALGARTFIKPLQISHSYVRQRQDRCRHKRRGVLEKNMMKRHFRN